MFDLPPNCLVFRRTILTSQSLASRVAALAALLFAVSLSAHAQTGAKPPATPTESSVVEIYGGYGDLQPFDSKVASISFQSIHNLNATVSVSGYFWKNYGAEIEAGYFNGPSARGIYYQCAPACESRDPMYYTLEGGVVRRFPHGRFVPFAHLLAGGVRVNGPNLQPLTWGEGFEGGGGGDYVLPVLRNLFALRGQADLQYYHAAYGNPARNGVVGGVADVFAFKISGGIVLRLAPGAPPAPMALACSVQPASIYPGDPVTATGTASGLNPKKTPKYTWSSTGGTVAGSDATAAISTAGLAPGSYTVTGSVSEGPKPYETASCAGEFSVKPFEPPTLSCSANPSTLTAGDTATITASGISPQNRPLTYSYSATSGQIGGSGATATLATSGVAPGTVTVTCNVSDDLGKTASATASVTISSPPAAPPKPESSSLCSISFERDKKRPTRVDNEGKACLDDLALTLQRNSDATLDLVGNANASEADAAKMSAERAVNTKDYLVKEKGIDASRIVVFTGAADAKSVTTTLVPAGAAPVSATPVDETAVKPIPRKPLGMRGHGKPRHPKEKAAQ